MSRTEEVFRPALSGKKIPIISLDNKWYKLMAGIERTSQMAANEERLKELLKRQGKLNTESKELRARKAKLMEKIVGAIDEDGKKEDYSAQIAECNRKLEEYQEELHDLPLEINEVNFNLMLETMEICYERLQENTERINEISAWITDMRIELKKNIVRKQDAELRNQQMYSYMHDIFGPEVIDIFDMKYNPAEEHVVKKNESGTSGAAGQMQPENKSTSDPEKSGSTGAESGQAAAAQTQGGNTKPQE